MQQQNHQPTDPIEPTSDSVCALTSTRFVLVEPSHPGNVGAAARALKTMGLRRLILVKPQHPNVLTHPDALALASGAQDVLAAAQITDSLETALSGVQWSVALSARPRGYSPPILTPRSAAQQARLVAAQGEVAYIFGNERAGLSNADVERCNALVHIPANPVYSSLNLAQAVQVLAYELRMTLLNEGDGPPHTPTLAHGLSVSALATSDEVERMFAHLQSAFIALDFLHPAQPKKLMSRLRRLFARTALEREEVNIMRGIAKRIIWQAKSRDLE
ncbi:RNA methyltransferase [Mycoavidus sp. B2-EB]|uniref:RNA methyltransferase n=1 Tax=Mycoavidus sp. B2-EB TaxID=2651972 RepID=UPI001629C78E|nr:RNA methyltransferase [Mycoavidus sp. B2-EB]BBO59751.1 tRNA (cytidine/uridine-2'-O-)-methyltransferase TrmJ [Mycoavidus sp. B2-EB]